MNHREFIEKNISADVIEDDCLCRTIQREFVDKALRQYDQSSYDVDLDGLVADTKKLITMYRHLVAPTTAKDYASNTDMTITTARKYLKNLAYVACDSEKKPFIYSLIEQRIPCHYG